MDFYDKAIESLLSSPPTPYYFLEGLDKPSKAVEVTEEKLNEITHLNLYNLKGRTLAEIADQFNLIFAKSIKENPTILSLHQSISYYDWFDLGWKQITLPYHPLLLAITYLGWKMGLLSFYNNILPFSNFGIYVLTPVELCKRITKIICDEQLIKKIEKIYDESYVVWYKKYEEELDDVYIWSYYYESICTQLKTKKEELKNQTNQKSNKKINKYLKGRKNLSTFSPNQSAIENIKKQLKHLQAQKKYFDELIYHKKYTHFFR